MITNNMSNQLLCILACLTSVYGHPADSIKLEQIQKDVGQLEENTYNMMNDVLNLSTTLRAKLAETGKSTCDNCGLDVAAFTRRLDGISGRIKAVKKYLADEKRKDSLLKTRSEGIIQNMTAEKNKINTVIDSMRDVARVRVVEFAGKIEEVDRAAQVEVKADGSVLHGGVGSPCVPDAGECTGADSECRANKCQCVPGKSFNLKNRKCVDTCASYGSTYQTISGYIIRGHNDLVLNGTTLKRCTRQCTEMATFVCRSFDYFPDWQQCFLSRHVKPDVNVDAWEYSSVGNHFQRDCL